ncbi:MAG: TetR/AcrR family transcriptional regulator [Bacteroidetes bacterium]|nr:TetR/AcrR family transcriptional regulator [Bacteroidota bacterium]
METFKNISTMEGQEYELYRRTTEVYMKNGIKNITMDDMAKELKVSKKTLYKYVKDRPELAAKSMEWKLAYDKKFVNDILAKNLNAIEELCEISNFYCANLMQMHPSLHFDLEKYYRHAWEQFIEYRNSFLYNTMLSNVNKGIRDGLYRADFDIEVIVTLYIMKVDMVFDPRVFPISKFKFAEVYIEMVKYHLSGIASEKGLKEMHRLLETKCLGIPKNPDLQLAS